MKPRFFKTPDDFRAWLQKHHARAAELLVGFYKRDTGKPSITWPESVDQALCFGWIDGIRRRVDDASYTIRFTPRTSKSNWSRINLRRVKELEALGLMHDAGRAAYQRGANDRRRVYSYEETRRTPLSPALEKLFRADRKAWTFFTAQPPGYQKTLTFVIMSAKKDETRRRRLEIVMAESRAGRRVVSLKPRA